MPLFRRKDLRLLVVAFALPLGLALPLVTRAEEITVFSAASLKDALDEIGTIWQEETGNTLVISYGGSSALAKQIAEGAPADVFFSASAEWMDWLQAEGQIQPQTRRNLLGNSLVLIAHGQHSPAVRIAPGFDLAGLLKGEKLAMAFVDSVPAGQYGKQSLESLGVWHQVEASVAQTENVRAALAIVATGEAPFGIVYASDATAAAIAGADVTVAGTFPADSHQPMLYPVALTSLSTKPQALAFLDLLSGDRAKSVFIRQGFEVLK